MPSLPENLWDFSPVWTDRLVQIVLVGKKNKQKKPFLLNTKKIQEVFALYYCLLLKPKQNQLWGLKPKNNKIYMMCQKTRLQEVIESLAQVKPTDVISSSDIHLLISKSQHLKCAVTVK